MHFAISEGGGEIGLGRMEYDGSGNFETPQIMYIFLQLHHWSVCCLDKTMVLEIWSSPKQNFSKSTVLEQPGNVSWYGLEYVF